jgi:hypothetical protein
MQRCIPWNYNYRQKLDFTDDVSSFHDLHVLKFVPEIGLVIMVEEKGKTVRLLSKGCW